ncbi:hypothetical protein D3C78_1077140 [compost metagenome]
MFGLGQRQRLDAAADGNAHLPGENALGSDADTHQPRGAHTVQGHARHTVGQAGGVSAESADVVTLGALLNGGAHDHVLDGISLDAGALQHRAYHMAAQDGGLGVVERTAKGLGQRRTGGGDDNYFMLVHGQIHSLTGLKV